MVYTGKERKKNRKILLQVAVFFAIGLLVTGVLTYYSQLFLSQDTVKAKNMDLVDHIAEDVEQSIKEYPNYQWLLSYWHEHYMELDIEYDVDYSSHTATEEKVQEWIKRHPDIPLKYADYWDIRNLPEKDKKMYAEICYTWLANRINQIKRANKIEFLNVVMTDNTYKFQFFVLSGADKGAVRGDKYGQVYKLGKRVTTSGEQQAAMMDARENSRHMARAAQYIDYYDYLGMVDDYNILTGIILSQESMIYDITEQTRQGTFIAMGYQLLLALICLLLILIFVLRPLKKVQQGIRMYKNSKDSEEVERRLSDVRSRNEIGRLKDDVVDLTREIDSYLDEIRTITSERERIGAELDLASRIQASMLPNSFPAFPEEKAFDIYATMEPAKEIGGDFYDFFMIDEDHLGIVMADVSGKGIPAALFMMASKIILANNAMQGKSPAEVLNDANRAICSNNQEEMFLTVWLGILELSTGKLTAANAGHEYPVLIGKDGSAELYRDKHGFVIGGMAEFSYTEYELTLEPGTGIFLYTDGVPEATNGQKELFGTDRMVAVFNEKRHTDPETILADVREAVDEFVAGEEQFDDLTMLGLIYRGKETV